MQVYQAEDKRSINSHPNAAFQVQLRGNPTTGAVWSVNYDHDFVSLRMTADGSAYEYARDSNLMGSPGIFTFTFDVQNKEGNSNLEFKYGRSWQATPWDTTTIPLFVQ